MVQSIDQRINYSIIRLLIYGEKKCALTIKNKNCPKIKESFANHTFGDSSSLLMLKNKEFISIINQKKLFQTGSIPDHKLLTFIKWTILKINSVFFSLVNLSMSAENL